MNARALACIAVVVGAVTVCALAMDVRTGLEFFLPEGGGGRRDAEMLRALSESALGKRVLVSIEAPDEASAVSAWHAMAGALADAPADQLSADATEALGKQLFEHRDGFVSPAPEQQIPALLSARGMADSLQALKRALGSDLGPLVRASAPRDPLGFFGAHMERMAKLDGGALRRVEGALLSAAPEDGRPTHAILILAARASALDGGAQRELLGAIDAAFARTNRAHGDALKLELAAVGRFSSAMESQTRDDVRRISIASFIGIALLCIVLLGSPRYLVLAILPLGAAFASGTAACLLLNGRIHALTFAFGAALVGVCIDYPIHLFNHHACRGGKGGGAHGAGSASAVRGALAMGCLTTVVGLSGMGLSDLPGIREVALFGAVGVAVALAVTLYVLPPLLPRSASPARHGRAAALAASFFAAIVDRRLVAVALVLACGLAGLAGLRQVRFEDDPRALTAIDPVIQAEDRRVRQRVHGSAGPERFALVEGSTLEEALDRNDRLAVALERAVQDGVLTGFQSLHSLLWSAELQRRNIAAVAQHLDIERVAAALADAGFVVEGFEPFFTERRDPARAGAQPLTVADLAPAVRSAAVDPWLLDLGGTKGVITRLVGIDDGEAVAQRVRSVEGGRVVDIGALRTRAYGDFRNRTMQLAGLGLIAVLAAMAFRYRNPRKTLAAMLPAALAAFATIGVLGLLGVALNLMHVVGLLLVLSMGADYAVFLVESLGRPGEARARGKGTELALIMACASTMLSFGLLATSKIPALASVGQSVAVGVALALVLAPATLGVAVRTGGGRNA